MGSYDLCTCVDLIHQQEVTSYPVQWIKVVEKLDEGAFHRKHMFQVVLKKMVPNGLSAHDLPSQITLYLQAAVSYSSAQCILIFRNVCGTGNTLATKCAQI